MIKTKVIRKTVKLLTVTFLLITVFSFNSSPQPVLAKNTTHVNLVGRKRASKRPVKAKPAKVKPTVRKLATDIVHSTPVNLPADTKNIIVQKPTITNFTSDIVERYSLSGYIWQHPQHITYTYLNLNRDQMAMVDSEIGAVNALGLVHLVKATDPANADITVSMINQYEEDPETAKIKGLLGMTSGTYFTNSNYKGLHYFTKINIHLEQNNLDDYGADYTVVFKHVFLHELGHGLGLAHLPETASKALVMYPTTDKYKIGRTSETAIEIDQQFISSLAALYLN